MTSPADPDAPIDDPVWLAADRAHRALIDASLFTDDDYECLAYFVLAIDLGVYIDIIDLVECEPEEAHCWSSSSLPPTQPDWEQFNQSISDALRCLTEAADLSTDLSDRLFFGWAIHEVNSFRPLNGS